MRFLPILPVIIAVACANLNLNSMYTSCSSDPKASCFGTGSSDCIARKSCDNLVTYRRNDTQLEFFMAGRMSSMKNTYMSIGFSEDAYMGSEAVVGCTLFHGNVYGVNLSYNGPGPGSFVKYDVVQNAGKYILGPAVAAVDGRLLCTFNLPLIFKVTQSLPDVDIYRKRYHLLIAVGRTWAPYKLGYHFRHRSFFTTQSLDFNTKVVQVVPLNKEGTRIGIAVHVIFSNMVFISLMPTLMLVARYYKECHVELRFFGKRLWFLAHLSISILGLILILVNVLTLSFIIGVFPLVISSPRTKIHYYVGVFVIVLYALTMALGVFTAFFDNVRRSKRISSIAHPTAGILTWLGGMTHIALVPYSVPSHLDYCTSPTLIAVAAVFHFFLTALSMSFVMWKADGKLNPLSTTATITESKKTDTEVYKQERQNPDDIASFVFSLSTSGVGSDLTGSSGAQTGEMEDHSGERKTSNESPDTLGSEFTWDSSERRKSQKEGRPVQTEQPTEAGQTDSKGPSPLVAERKKSKSKGSRRSKQVKDDEKLGSIDSSKNKPSKPKKPSKASKRKKSSKGRKSNLESQNTGSGGSEETDQQKKERASAKFVVLSTVNPFPMAYKTFGKGKTESKTIQIVPQTKRTKSTILSSIKHFPDFDDSSFGSSGLPYTHTELPHEDKFWSRVHGTKKWNRNRAFFQIPVGASKYKESPNTRTFEVIIGFYFVSSLILAVVNSWLLYPSTLGGACFVGKGDERKSQWFEL